MKRSEYLVRLRGAIDLMLTAHCPEHACQQVASFHPALGDAIVSVGSDDMDMTAVRGQCEKCSAWIFAEGIESLPLPRVKVKCPVCKEGKPAKPRPLDIPKPADDGRINAPPLDDDDEHPAWEESDRRPKYPGEGRSHRH